MNPALINPSFTGIDGQGAAFLAYRKQWMGVSGAPSVANLSVQSPLSGRRGSFGANFTNDTQGLLSSTGVMLSLSYNIPLQDGMYVRFGMSGGAGWNRIDLEKLNFGTTGDDVVSGLLSNSFQVLGNAGLSFHTKTFHLGASIPNIFQPAYLSKDAFTVSEVKPFESVIVQTSYRLYLGDPQYSFEPHLLYRYNQTLPSQIEAAGIMHLKNMAWVGASYKQNFGISGLLGYKLNSLFAVGYSYTFKNTGYNELARPSHEIQLGLLFGAHDKKNPVYSFVNSELKKDPKRNTTQDRLAAERKRQEMLARANNNRTNTSGNKGNTNNSTTPSRTGTSNPRIRTGNDPMAGSDPVTDSNTQPTDNQPDAGNTVVTNNTNTGNNTTGNTTNNTTGNQVVNNTNTATGNTTTNTDRTNTGNTTTGNTTNNTSGNPVVTNNTNTTTGNTTANNQGRTNTTGNTNTGNTNNTTGNQVVTNNTNTTPGNTTTNNTTGNQVVTNNTNTTPGTTTTNNQGRTNTTGNTTTGNTNNNTTGNQVVTNNANSTTGNTTNNTGNTTNTTTGNQVVTNNANTATGNTTNNTTGNQVVTNNTTQTPGNTTTNNNPGRTNTTGNTTNTAAGNQVVTNNTNTGNTTTNTTQGNTTNNQVVGGNTNPNATNTSTTPATGEVKLDEHDPDAHEQEILQRLDDHSDNPTEEHGGDEDDHAHSERHEFHKRGDHQSEMDYGNHIIIGAFRSEANAKRVTEEFQKMGFADLDYGFLSTKGVWYIHFSGFDDIEEAKSKRNKYRKMKIFKDAWLLTVTQ